MESIIKTAFVTFVTILLTANSGNSQQPARPAAAPGARPQAARAPRVVSPEIHPDNRVTFRLYSKDVN